MSSSLATADLRRTRPASVPPVVDVLHACLDGDPVPAEGAGLHDDDRLYRLAELALHHRVANAVFLGIRNAVDPDHPAFHRLQREYIDNVARHLRTLADLAELAPVLDGAGIPWMVIKGPVLAEGVYPRPDLRSYGDLDVVVPPARFGEAIRVMEDARFEVADRNWTVIHEQRRAQLHAVLRLGTVTDLHWHLVNREAVRESFDVDTEELFRRAQRVSVGGQRVLTLDPQDTLAHLCIHAGLDGGHRLRSLKDIDLAAGADVDWDTFVHRASEWRARLLIATMLERAVVHLDAPVPPVVIRALHNSSVTMRVSRRLQRTWSPERITDETPSAGALAVQALRDNVTSTVRAALGKVFGRRGADEWKHIARAHTGHGPTQIGSGALGVLHPSGDGSTRGAYFEQVLEAAARSRQSGPVMLVGSTGGHLAQLYRLRSWWVDLDRMWVTFDKTDSRSLLQDEIVEWAYHPTTRNIPNLVRNARLAWQLLRRYRPSLVVSNGAGVAFPFFVFARLLRIPTVYIEVYDRIDIPSLTGRLCYRFSNVFALQWDEQRKSYPNGKVIGRLL